MAVKKQTARQRRNLRNELGLNTKPLPVVVNQPLNPAASGVSNEDVNVGVVQEEQREKPSHWEILKASVQNDNSITDLLTAPPEFLIDPQFNGVSYWDNSKQRIDAMPGVDLDEVMEDVIGASSSQEAEHWLSKHEKDYVHEQTLIDAGMKGMLTRMVVSVIDPVDITLSLVTAGAAGVLLKGRKFGKIVTGALTAGVATGGTEAFLASNNASRDETDVIYATLAGLGLGAGISGLIARNEAKKLAALSDDIASDNLDSALSKLEGKGESAGARRRASESTKPDKKLAGKAYDNVQEMLEDTDEINFSFKGLNRIFQTMQSKIFFSPSQIVRKVSSRMLEGGYQSNRALTRSRTAEGTASLLRKTFEAGVFRESLPMFKAWAKRNQIGSIKRNLGAKPGEDFYSEVGRAMRGDVGEGVSSEAQQAAKKLRKYMDNIHQLAQDAGVKGFDSKALDDYFPRMLNRGKFDAVRVKYGNDALGDWFARSIEGANDDISAELAAKLGHAYVHTMNRKIAGIEQDLLNGVRLDDIDALREMFEGYKGLDGLLDELESMKLSEGAKRGTVSHGKRRMQFDESASAPIKTADGDEEMLHFNQMFENDARKVLKRYSHTMAGHIGMAKEVGIKSRKDFEEIENAIIDEANMAGTARSLDDAQSEIKAMREAYDLIVGRNTIDTNPTGDISKLSRTWTGYTYSTRGGQFGVNAMGEFGRVIGAAGIRSFIRSMPEWASLMRRGVDGEIEHGLARELELMFAPGINGMTGVAIRNMDEFGERMDGSSLASRVAQKVDAPLRVAGRATATASGLNFLTDLPQRIAGVEMIRKFARFANGGKISDGQQARIRNMGITPEMQERIFKQMRDSNEVEELVSESVRLTPRLSDGTEPAVTAGQTRLYRGSSDTQKFDDVFDAEKLDEIGAPQPDRKGEFYTTDRDTADYYRDAYNANKDARIDYVDVPTSSLDNLRFKDGDEFIIDTAELLTRKTSKTVNKGGAGVYKDGRLVDLDHSKWTDDEALDALNFAMNREVRSIIQENDIATVTKYFHHPVGRVLMQFLRFPMEAVNKQLAHTIHFADAESARGVISALFITSTVYIAQTSIDFANNPEERKKRLTPENIAKVAFMRTGVSSMIPTATDMGLEALGFEKQFGFGRSSGLTTGLMGSPVSDTIDTGIRLGGNITQSIFGDQQISSRDIYDGSKLIPGYRTLGFSNAVNAIGNMFPEERKE